MTHPQYVLYILPDNAQCQALQRELALRPLPSLIIQDVNRIIPRPTWLDGVPCLVDRTLSLSYKGTDAMRVLRQLIERHMHLLLQQQQQHHLRVAPPVPTAPVVSPPPPPPPPAQAPEAKDKRSMISSDLYSEPEPPLSDQAMEKYKVANSGSRGAGINQDAISQLQTARAPRAAPTRVTGAPPRFPA